MRKVREVLRLHFEAGCTQREIRASTGLSKGSVSEYLKRAREAGLAWETARAMGDAEVEAALFRDVGRNEPLGRSPIDFAWVHTELSKTGVTLQLLVSEYQEAAVARQNGTRPYQYSQFCDLYTAWRKTLSYSMRQVHRAGERLFVDYSGKRPSVVDAATGELVPVELFVAVLGASNYTYAEATRSQQKADFVASTIRALEYFGGVPEIVVPDQLRSAVSGPDRYDPELNPTYLELAQHYGFAVVPARPRKPRDKAKVEGGVLVAQRWILACLRHRTFFSLDALNEAIAELLEKLNARPFQKLEGCRSSAFVELDKPALKPLPGRRYERAEWKKGKVHIDYHVDFEGRFYSVPCALVGAHVEVRATTSMVEILFRGARVASHVRSYGRLGTQVTSDAHRPKKHSDYGDWPPERMLAWAGSIGPSVRLVVEKIFARYPRPELGYRPFLALTRDAKTFGPERLDAACARGLALAGSYGPTRKTIHAILVRNLDSAPLPDAEIPDGPRPLHDNIRGPDYFDQKEGSA
ncbi:MAG: IS21 family transposase [Proteobacteria bacterium]|nr:MAG: IS21 family transposase [Pseudomonadota bacterium]